jgi:hypothetical protein
MAIKLTQNEMIFNDKLMKVRTLILVAVDYIQFFEAIPIMTSTSCHYQQPGTNSGVSKAPH